MVGRAASPALTCSAVLAQRHIPPFRKTPLPSFRVRSHYNTLIKARTDPKPRPRSTIAPRTQIGSLCRRWGAAGRPQVAVHDKPPKTLVSVPGAAQNRYSHERQPP